MINFNERTNTLLHKNIPLTFYSRKGWCWLCVRGELEMGTDYYILTPSSSNHSSTSFAFWLGCLTVGHWGPKPSVWSWFSLCWHPISNWNWNSNWPKLSVAPGYIIVSHPPASCGRTHLPPSLNSTTSTGQGDIPISSTGCTCFAVLLLIYTGAFLDWRLGRGSICNNWCSWYSHQRINKGTRGLRNKRTSGNHPNYCIIQIGQNTEKSPRDLRRLAVTQTPVKDHQPTIMWKIL